MGNGIRDTTHSFCSPEDNATLKIKNIFTDNNPFSNNNRPCVMDWKWFQLRVIKKQINLPNEYRKSERFTVE